MGKPVGGSIPTGPSEQYLRLLRGEIEPKEYAASVEKRVRGWPATPSPDSSEKPTSQKRS